MPIILDPSITPPAPPFGGGGTTLAVLEQETARRLGPYQRYFTDRQVPTTSTFDFAYFPTLKSNVDQDGPTNLYLLRRGIDVSGNPVTLDAVDRQRLVSVWDPASGQIRTDRPWGTPCVPGEYVEFHHLDPEQELRPAILAGLRRCFFNDTLQIGPQSEDQWGAIDLTAQLPWLTGTWQVASMKYGWWTPYGDSPFDVHQEGGHVILTGSTATLLSPSWLWLSAWRPHSSWVNGADSVTGPTLDTDTLDVDLDYAASAAHIEAWHLFPDRLQASAAGGLQATQQMAANEFTRQAAVFGPQRTRKIGFTTWVHV